MTEGICVGETKVVGEEYFNIWSERFGLIKVKVFQFDERKVDVERLKKDLSQCFFLFPDEET